MGREGQLIGESLRIEYIVTGSEEFHSRGGGQMPSTKIQGGGGNMSGGGNHILMIRKATVQWETF